MTEPTFKRPELEDKEIISSYFEKAQSRSCERTFVNVYLWSRHYKVQYAIIEDTLVFRDSGKNLSFTYPAGEPENVKKALEFLMEYCKEKDVPSLAGKKLHGKRNHINKFKALYPDWSYEPLNDDNVEDCFQMALKWRNKNGCEDDPEKNAEMCVTLNSLRLYKELGLKGGVLKADGKIVAFTVGEPVSDDTFVVHIEKAFAEVDGAYPMINQQFVQHECMEYEYVNREEDTGAEGLRKAKLSYRPAFLEEKGIVKEME